MGPILDIVPRDRRRQSQRLIDRGGQVLGRLRVGAGKSADPVGRADDPAADHSSAGEENGLDLAPVVAAGELVGLGNVEIRGVRPNSPAITISVESSSPLAFRSSSSAERAWSVGGKSLSFRWGNMLPCVSQVSLLPRLT